MKKSEVNYNADVAVIGGGAAGIFSAFSCLSRGLSVVLIESEDKLGGKLNLYKDKQIIDLPGFVSITAGKLLEELDKQLNSLENKAQILKNTSITSILDEKDGYLINIVTGVVSAKYIIISQGYGKFNPIKLEIPGATSLNVVYSVSNFSKYQGNIVVLGGGDSALDYANEFSKFKNNKVSIIHRKPTFRGKDSTVEQLKNGKVDILLDYTIDSLTTEKDLVKSIKLKSNADGSIKELKLDYLVVAYGQIVAEDNIFGKLVEFFNKNILVNEYYETKKKNIFCIGDSCFYPGKVANLCSAFGEGTLVAKEISHRNNPYI